MRLTWEHFGITLGGLWAYEGDFESLLGRFGTTLDHSGITLGHFGMTLGHFGVTFGAKGANDEGGKEVRRPNGKPEPVRGRCRDGAGSLQGGLEYGSKGDMKS